MRHFYAFAGVVLALYVLVFGILAVTNPTRVRGGTFSMEFKFLLVYGGALASGIIALGGAGMFLWQFFVRNNRELNPVGVVITLVLLVSPLLYGGGSFLGLIPGRRTESVQSLSHEEAGEANDLAHVREMFFARVRQGQTLEAERFLVASPFTEVDLLRHLLTSVSPVHREELPYFKRLLARHEDFIPELPLRARLAARSYARFDTGNPVETDGTGTALVQAFGAYYGAPGPGPRPELFPAVEQAAKDLSPTLQSHGSPLFFILSLPYLQVFPSALGLDITEPEKARRRQAMTALQEHGFRLKPEETQDAEVQAALRAAGLADLLD